MSSMSSCCKSISMHQKQSADFVHPSCRYAWRNFFDLGKRSKLHISKKQLIKSARALRKWISFSGSKRFSLLSQCHNFKIVSINKKNWLLYNINIFLITSAVQFIFWFMAKFSFPDLAIRVNQWIRTHFGGCEHVSDCKYWQIMSVTLCHIHSNNEFNINLFHLFNSLGLRFKLKRF